MKIVFRTGILENNPIAADSASFLESWDRTIEFFCYFKMCLVLFFALVLSVWSTVCRFWFILENPFQASDLIGFSHNTWNSFREEGHLVF
jgi:hypothetical protein